MNEWFKKDEEEWHHGYVGMSSISWTTQAKPSLPAYIFVLE